MSSKKSSRARLELLDVETSPLATVRYLNAARGGGTVSEHLEITRARVRGLPDGLDAILCTSDLQGVVRPQRNGPTTLLGIAVAEKLEELAFDGALPAAERTGVILAGDLYSVPDADKRGGHGDVAEVWRAFASPFAWVAGVAGNHDDTSGIASGVAGGGKLHLLDADLAEDIAVRWGLRVGGVGLIAGNPEKKGRRAEDDQLARLELIAESEVDILVCHEGPNGVIVDPRRPSEERDQLGHAGIRAIVEAHGVPLTVCGHVHWPDPLARLPRGAILNVDARVVALVAVK